MPLEHRRALAEHAQHRIDPPGLRGVQVIPADLMLPSQRVNLCDQFGGKPMLIVSGIFSVAI